MRRRLRSTHVPTRSQYPYQLKRGNFSLYVPASPRHQERSPLSYGTMDLRWLPRSFLLYQPLLTSARPTLVPPHHPTRLATHSKGLNTDQSLVKDATQLSYNPRCWGITMPAGDDRRRWMLGMYGDELF